MVRAFSTRSRLNLFQTKVESAPQPSQRRKEGAVSTRRNRWTRWRPMRLTWTSTTKQAIKFGKSKSKSRSRDWTLRTRPSLTYSKPTRDLSERRGSTFARSMTRCRVSSRWNMGSERQARRRRPQAGTWERL